jgi:hypothetical protein
VSVPFHVQQILPPPLFGFNLVPIISYKVHQNLHYSANCVINIVIMGINLFAEDGLSMTLWGPNSARGRAQSYDPEAPGSTRPNPNPEVFEVRRAEPVGKFVVCLVKYPDATTFEGNKVMILTGITQPGVIESQHLDPHFSEDGLVVARFRPDEEGWELALSVAGLLDQQNQNPQA